MEYPIHEHEPIDLDVLVKAGRRESSLGAKSAIPMEFRSVLDSYSSGGNVNCKQIFSAIIFFCSVVYYYTYSTDYFQPRLLEWFTICFTLTGENGDLRLNLVNFIVMDPFLCILTQSFSIDCPYMYSKVGKTCLSLACPNDYMAWKEARLYCRLSKGGDLAIFNTYQDLADVMEFLRIVGKSLSSGGLLLVYNR